MNLIRGKIVDIYFWLNGKDKEHSFKLKINLKNIINLKSLKEYVKSEILSNKELTNIFSRLNSNVQIHHFYNENEIRLEDSDVQYLKSDEIIFFSLDNSSFKSSNHFNQFEFIRWIKSGGYGQVYLAKHVFSGKEYAIKQIDTSNFSNEDLYNISREYLILRQMMNKNVIKCYNSFAHDKKFYTVMDYAEGGELSCLLKEKGILSESLAKNLFKQIYDAVCYIHSQNIVHRDLKPNNILFLDKEQTQIVIIDFGISGFSNGNQRDKIKAGTTTFLPPEMVSGEEYSSNRKLDIWALGVILYRMVEGVYPFEGKNTKEIAMNIMKSKLEFNKKIRISYQLKTLIEGMLEKNYRFRIDDDSELFNKWFEASLVSFKRKKTLEARTTEKKSENHFNYLTPTKSTALKRLPTHSYNNFYKNNKQNLISKFNNIKEKETKEPTNNYYVSSMKKVLRQNSLILPMLNVKNARCNHFNSSLNYEVNCFRIPHRKSVEHKKKTVFQTKNNNIEDNIILIEQNENENDSHLDSNINSNMNSNINNKVNDDTNIVNMNKDVNINQFKSSKQIRSKSYLPSFKNNG